MPSLRLRRVVAGVVLVVQFLALFVPRTPQVDTGGFPADKLVHLLLFAAATAALIWAGAPVTATALGMSGYAAASEIIQGSLYTQRSGDIGDVIADILGVGLGLAAGRRLQRAGARDAIRGVDTARR